MISSAMKIKARKFIQQRTANAKTGWLGVAPSYLQSELDISYNTACLLLLALQEEGFIYDNGHGNYRRLSDGRTCPTRFYMTSS
jgi:hypothetical protein